MQQRIITLLCMAGMAISAHTQAASLKIRPNAPQRYVVKNGDTLWGISGKYLYSPWQWNRLWGANRNAIRNPHLFSVILALNVAVMTGDCGGGNQICMKITHQFYKTRILWLY